MMLGTAVRRLVLTYEYGNKKHDRNVRVLLLTIRDARKED